MPVEPDGGDPACWLDRVCAECGRFVDDDEDHVCVTAPVSPPAS